MLITKEELKLRKAREQVPLECEVCKSIFYRPKNYVLRGIKGTRKLCTCGEKCRRIFLSNSLKIKFSNPFLCQSNRNETKKELVKFAGGKCCLCGYDKCITSLEFHHRDPMTKSFSIGRGLTKKYPKEKLMDEVRKCILLCSNCHGEVNEGLTKIEDDV